jgi:hypothetical protein
VKNLTAAFLHTIEGQLPSLDSSVGCPDPGSEAAMRLYNFVGPRRVVELAHAPIARCEPADAQELRRWLLDQRMGSPVALTYVVTLRRRLCVAPREAEHVACARAMPVLAAGEVTVAMARDAVRVLSLTNQSSGYCPEPSCFEAVTLALDALGILAPTSFEHEFIFRRCPTCWTIVVVKDDDFTCPSCETTLPPAWNLADFGPID